MTKFKRKALAFGALIALGVGGVVSTAAFTDNAFVASALKAGTLTFTVNGVDATESAPVTLTMTDDQSAPGSSSSSTLTLDNTGTLPILVDMSTVVIGEGNLSNSAQVTFTDRASSDVLYTGPSKDASFNDLAVARGENVVIDVKLDYPNSMGNDLQGTNDNLTLRLAAEHDK